MTIELSRQELETRCTEAQNIVRAAGAKARESFLNRETLSIKHKGTQDWATNADLEVEELIRRRIAQSFPGEAILGEEQGQSDGREDANQNTWVIDKLMAPRVFCSVYRNGALC